LELNTPDEPAWTYFDAQHAFIMKQMASAYESAVANLKGICLTAVLKFWSRLTIADDVAIRDRAVPQIPDSEPELTAQLQLCVAAVESRIGGDNVIGLFFWPVVIA
jgi:hypothetical protein